MRLRAGLAVTTLLAISSMSLVATGATPSAAVNNAHGIPVLGALHVERRSGPSKTNELISGPVCPSVAGKTRIVSYTSSPDSGNGASSESPGRPMYASFTAYGSKRVYTFKFKCLAGDINRPRTWQVTATYPPFTFTINQAQPTIAVSPATVRRGAVITLSTGRGCGRFSKPTIIEYYVQAGNGKVYSHSRLRVNKNGAWPLVRFTIPSAAPIGKWSAYGACESTEKFASSTTETETSTFKVS